HNPDKESQPLVVFHNLFLLSRKKIRTSGEVCCPGYCSAHLLHEKNFIAAVDFFQLDFDHLIHGGGHLATHERRLDPQFAMAAIDQNAEPHLPRTSLGEKRIQSRSHSAPGEEHIVDQHNIEVLD